MEISEYLLNKYNAPVPRYTSYPTANHFREHFPSDEFKGMLREADNCNPRNIAFYIHIPFCKRICYYCGCNSCPTGKGNQIGPYINALKKEIAMISGYIDKSRLVSQIHYGGGTPNSIDHNYLKEINEIFFSNFKFIENPEIAIECNPEFLDFNSIDALLSARFNRFSLGIQDFDNKILRMVNRAPSALPPAELLGYLKGKLKKASVNFDFIYGLPGQTAGSFSDTIGKALAIKPDRIVTFSYAHVPWLKKHQLILEKRGLPASGEKMKMFLSAYDMLSSSGYKPLGLDHFVLPGDDLYRAFTENQLHRNFQGYCTRRTTGQVYAFGVTAISQFENGYAQNAREVQQYIDTIESGALPVEKGYSVNRIQKITREVINKLMCNKRLKFGEIATSLQISVNELKEAVNFREENLDSFIADGLVKYSEDEVEVTENGTMFIRNIAAVFDREYHEKAGTYSKTV